MNRAISQTGSATAQPPATAASLRAQIDAVQASINDAAARRAGLMSRINASSSSAERVRIRNTELRTVDGELARLNSQLGRLRADLRQSEVLAANPPSQSVLPQPSVNNVTPAAPATTSVPPNTGIDVNSVVIGGAAAVVLLTPLFLVIAWRAGRRAALAGRRAAGRDDGNRLARMEEAIASVTLEVERVSESQRFLTNALVGDATQSATEKLGARR